jgi:fibronectin-binding autotransporter adhesin
MLDQTRDSLLRSNIMLISRAVYIALLTVIPASIPHIASAASANWNVNADGDWSLASNWSAGGPPNGAGQTAGLTFNLDTNAKTVTLDISATVSTLNIGDPSSDYQAYILSGASTLTFDNSGGAVTIAKTTTGNTVTDQINVPITLKGNLTINNTATNGVVEINGSIGQFDATNRSLTVTGSSGNAMVLLTTANTYAGGTTMGSGGRLRITNGSALGSGAIASLAGGTTTPKLELAGGITVNNNVTAIGGGDTNPTTAPRLASVSGNNTFAGSILNVSTGGSNYPIHSVGTALGDFFTISGDIINNRNAANDNRNLRLGGAGNGEVSGVIKQTSLSVWHLFKDGGGTWTLSGNNTYTGATTVNAGKLIVDGTHTGGGTYTVNAGATLGGMGSISALINLSGAIEPGTSPETLELGGLTINTGAISNFELDRTDTTTGDGINDLIDLGASGVLTVAGNNVLNVTATSSGFFDDGTYTLLHYGSLGAISGTTTVNILGDGLAPNQTAILTFTTSSGSGDLQLTFTTVPEPASLVISILGLTCFATIVRRKRR